MTKNTGQNPLKLLFAYNYQYILAFFLPVIILWGAYCIFGVYPVNNNSVLALDLNGQYANYYDYMYDVLAGKESLFYSWSRNLSGEFMGVIGYYLASPFSFLVWIFPREHITEGLLAMILAKTGSIGLCTAIYLDRGKKLKKDTVIIFSMLFAMSAYTITQTMNPMWLDGVLVLPLVVYGIEALIDKGHFRLLIGALIYAFVTNFYIGYMIAIFTALYFIYYFFASEQFKYIRIYNVITKFVLAIIVAVVSAASSAFMLIPVINSLKLGKFEFSKPDYTVKANFNLIEFFDRLLPNSYDTVRMSGTPLIYCGIITIILVVCYFVGTDREIFSRRKRICSAGLLLILVASMYIRPLDMYWHGGQLPNWLPYRYSFMLSFVLVAWAAETFDNISAYSRKTMGFAAGGLFALMIFLENKDNFDPDLGNKGRELLDGVTVILPAIFILFIITAMLIQLRDKFHQNNGMVVILATLIIGELLYNTCTTIYKQHTDIVYSSRDSYVDYFTPVREVVEGIKKADDGFYRIEKNFFRTSNDEIALSMYGLSHSSSTMNSAAIAFLKPFGMTSHSHNTRYSGATPLIDDIFGIKYILSSKDNSSHNVKEVSDITVEENLDAMPIAYLVDNAVLQLDLDVLMEGEDRNNIFQPQSKLLSYMIGKREIPDYFTLLEDYKETKEIDNLTESVSGTHEVYKVVNVGNLAQITYAVTADRDGELFLWLPSDYARRIDVVVEKFSNGELTDIINAGGFFEADYYRILSLGEFYEGEEFVLRFKLTKDELYYKDIYIAGLDNELYGRDYGTLQEMNKNTVVQKLSPTHLKITTSNDAERLLLTTIPDEPGWTVTVNGVDTNYETALNALISVPLPAGENVVELKFTVNGYPFALFVSLGGIVCYAALCLAFVMRRKRKREQILENEIYNSYENTGADDDVGIDDFEDELIPGSSEKVYIGDYDKEKMQRSIESIVKDINEINSYEQLNLSGEVSEIEERTITGATDLFPEDEIARLWQDDGTDENENEERY